MAEYISQTENNTSTHLMWEQAGEQLAALKNPIEPKLQYDESRDYISCFSCFKSSSCISLACKDPTYQTGVPHLTKPT